MDDVCKIVCVGLSAAIPPSAYLMAQGQPGQPQQPYALPHHAVPEKRAGKKEESAFGLVWLQGLQDCMTVSWHIELPEGPLFPEHTKKTLDSWPISVTYPLSKVQRTAAS